MITQALGTFGLCIALAMSAGCKMNGSFGIGGGSTRPAVAGGGAGDVDGEAGGGDARGGEAHAGEGARHGGNGKQPRVELWDDGMADVDMDAKPFSVSLDPADENATCNGLDDDGDGKIDEECGLKSGGIQITAAWEDGSDVDLLLEHASQTIDLEYRQQRELHGGSGKRAYTLALEDGKGSCSCQALRNRDGSFAGCKAGCTERRGECFADDSRQYVENVYLDSDRAPPGDYKVLFRADRDCGTRRADAEKGGTYVTVSLSVNGKVIGVYRSGTLGSQSSAYPIFTLSL